MPVPTSAVPVKVTRRSLVEQVAATVRDQILTGVYLAGCRLHPKQLAVELGVSSATVQHALQVLSAAGLVEVLANRCNQVTVPEPDAAAHAAASLRMIASALTDTDIATLQRVYALIDTAYGSTDHAVLLSLRVALAEAAGRCGNRLLTRILTPGIDGAIYRLRFTAPATTEADASAAGSAAAVPGV